MQRKKWIALIIVLVVFFAGITVESIYGSYNGLEDQPGFAWEENAASGGYYLATSGGKFLSSLPLGLGNLWVGWDRRKQGWHDRIAGTCVIRERRS